MIKLILLTLLSSSAMASEYTDKVLIKLEKIENRLQSKLDRLNCEDSKSSQCQALNEQLEDIQLQMSRRQWQLNE